MAVADTAAFEALVGKRYQFYGVDNTAFKLGRRIWQAIEDESDGWRSYLGSIEITTPEGWIFFREPIARVKVVAFDDGYTQGFQLVDTADKHVWLTVGTENYDDWYPCFVFRYEPKEA